jgi:hypothetical protein
MPPSRQYFSRVAKTDDVEARWEELVPPYQDLAANIS